MQRPGVNTGPSTNASSNDITISAEIRNARALTKALKLSRRRGWRNQEPRW